MYPARPTGCPSPASQRPRRPCGTANRYLRTSRRRLNNAKTIEQQDGAERALNKLARTFTAQMEALKRYRTGGQQKVTVEHVHVHEGGQAIVGHVEQRTGGGRAKRK